ncbi:MAG: tail fiber protein [Bacteroidales bacterium]|nr:tail fiber protein [Bacteroidales bacterium]MBR6928600.1 tail fiber protein [Bacteroidales bacterium]
MKKVIFIFALIVAIAANAQNSGLGFNYQAVVRNVNGVLLADSDVNLRVSLYPGQQASTPTWVEIHAVHTDFSGCFGITIGKGERDNSSIVQNYSDVNFSAIYYWLKIEILEGDTYREVSYSQLPSSPYADVAYNALIPAGVIVPFGGEVENIPSGWLLCDGSEVSRSEYPSLYDAVGVCWGIGDGATTFNLPDMRGMFLRGVSGDSGNDEDANERFVLNDNGGNTGNNVGSYQGDAIRNIIGEIDGGGDDGPLPAGGEGTGAFEVGPWRGNGASGSNAAGAHSFNFDASRIVPVGNDNRPKNVYVNYIIKY